MRDLKHLIGVYLLMECVKEHKEKPYCEKLISIMVELLKHNIEYDLDIPGKIREKITAEIADIQHTF